MVKETWWPELKLPPINLWSLPPWQTFEKEPKETKQDSKKGEDDEGNKE
jgi:hypothetical protein